MTVHGCSSRLGGVTQEWFILAACLLVILVRTGKSRFMEGLYRKVGDGQTSTHTGTGVCTPPHVTFLVPIFKYWSLHWICMWFEAKHRLFCLSSPPLAMWYPFPQMAWGRNLRLTWSWEFICEVKPQLCVAVSAVYLSWLHICSVSP